MAKIGVVFSNLGTPKSPEPKDVGNYLREFLMDPYVIQIHWLIRSVLVKGIIAPFRSKKSAKNYQKVWTSQGSPLLVETQKAAAALQTSLGSDYQVEVAMRYGEPSFDQVRDKLADCQEIIFFPQYPQYAASTVQTGLDAFYQSFKGQNVKVVPPYYDHQEFVTAYADFLKPHLDKLGHDHLLMSFHGLPASHLTKSDPSGQHCQQVNDCCAKAEGDVLATCYRAQCMRSAQALAKALGLSSQQYSVSFQSRLGRQQWIEPYTEDMYKQLRDKGVKKLAVICPGFSVDGLETLEEIAMEGKEIFMEHGGEEFHYIPCLNDDPRWISACAQLVKNT